MLQWNIGLTPLNNAFLRISIHGIILKGMSSMDQCVLKEESLILKIPVVDWCGQSSME